VVGGRRRERSQGGAVMMTRQHYKLIAQTLKEADADWRIVEAFVKVLELDNPRFQPDKFREASI